MGVFSSSRHRLLSSLLLLLLCILVPKAFARIRRSKPPNILFLLIDDLGWNDVGFNHASDAITPNIDRLARKESLVLHQSYAQHLCTMTRSALLSGRYPMRMGLQHQLIKPDSTYGLPFSVNHTSPNGTLSELEVRLLPQLLRERGYRTHLVGKWHLGMASSRMFPTNRGFDTFYGLLLGEGDHYFHNRSYDGMNGQDLRNNTDPIRSRKFSSYLFGNVTKDLLMDYGRSNRSEPWFIQHSFQCVHTPNQAPQTFKDAYDNNEELQNDTDRLDRVAMSTAVDSVVDQLVNVLKNEGMWQNTLLILQSDNGGPIWSDGNNFPLRGGKGSLFEGGVRTVTLVSGGVLNARRRGQRMDQMMHVVDWLPTLMQMVGVDDDEDELKGYLSTMDGVSQWDVIQNEDADPVRSEILYNIDPLNCTSESNVCGGIRMDQFKLVLGTEVTSYQKQLTGWTSLNDVNESQMNPTVDCGGPPPKFIPDPLNCPWNGRACLYDLSKDPCEYNDVSHEYPRMYQLLMGKLIKYNQTQVLPLQLTHPVDPEGADPANHDGFWSPWLD